MSRRQEQSRMVGGIGRGAAGAPGGSPATRRQAQRGAVIVETAIILLAFFTLVFGVFEAGRVMSVQATLTDAAREGARVAVLPLTGTSTLAPILVVEQKVKDFAAANAIDPASVQVSVSAETTGATQYTKVTVTCPYRVLTIPIFNMLQVTLSGSSRMRNETSAL